MKTLPVEPRIQDRPIDALDVLISRLVMPLTTRKASKVKGAGVLRAEARLRAKRKANASIPFEAQTTRQQRRRSAILRGRQIMTVARREANQRGIRGGSAIIRNPVDVDRVLG